jgi:demethylmenaquinone methyltransferase/2-methoxy-6-polyprenyl-1,4-benzoquinol methylase
MANTYFEPGARRAARVQDLFNRIARRYDLINDLQSFGLHRRWKRRVIELARAQPGHRALDVCCGTGDLALGLARCGVDVVGLDFTERMLEVAEHRKSKVQSLQSKVSGEVAGGEWRVPGSVPAPRTTHHAPRLPHFVRGDAQQIPFHDSSIDVVTVGYGLRNLADWETGLREMQRVAKPGGRVLILEFGKPDNALWREIYFGYLKLFVPCLGLICCGSAIAYSYILESLKHYPAQQGVAAKMRELGLVNVRVVNFLGGVMSVNYGEKGGVMRNT